MVSRVHADEISVNVIPQPVKSSNLPEAEENGALRTPLNITGSPKELDEELPKQLVEFVGAHLGLSSTLKTAKEQMEAAAKAAKESARKPSAAKSGDSRKERAGTEAAAADDQKERSGAKPEETISSAASSTCTVQPVSGDLFDTPS
jgi:PRTRC genetic system protein E